MIKPMGKHFVFRLDAEMLFVWRLCTTTFHDWI